MDRKVRTDFGEIARKIRKAKGWSQERVSYGAEIEQTELSKIERGVRKASPELAESIGAALGLSEKEIFQGQEK